MYEIVVLLVCIIVVAVWFLRRTSAKRFPPGPALIPILGAFLEKGALTQFHTIMSSWAKQYGPIVSFNLVARRVVILSDAKLLREAYGGEDFHTFLNDRPSSFVGKYLYFGNKDVAFSKYDFSARLRKFMHKGLHLYGAGIQNFEQRTIEELGRFVEDLRATGGKETDPRALVKTSICMVMSSLLTGEHNSLEAEENRHLMFDFAESMMQIALPMNDFVLQKLPFLRFVPGRYRNIYRRSLTHRDRNVEKFFNEQKATYRDGVERGLIDVLIRMQREQSADNASGFRLEDDNIIGIMLNIIVGAADTSVLAVLWLLLLLLNHPDCMKKIRREVDDVVGQDRYPSLSDRPNMPYTRVAIMEALRYVSFAPFIFPHVCTKDINFHGYDITKDTVIIGNAWFIHHDKNIWGDPWNFRPERFLDEDGQLVGSQHELRQSFVPFSVGKRSCPGEALGKSRVFLYLTTLLQKFQIEPSASVTSSDPRKVDGGLVMDVPSFTCRFIPRREKKTHPKTTQESD